LAQALLIINIEVTDVRKNIAVHAFLPRAFLVLAAIPPVLLVLSVFGLFRRPP
jgi:hypothetical protein